MSEMMAAQQLKDLVAMVNSHFSAERLLVLSIV